MRGRLLKSLAAALCIATTADAADAGKHIEVQFLPPHDAPSHDHANDQGNGAHKMNGHGALPLQQFMRLFPLDLPKAHIKVIRIGPGGVQGGGGNAGGDPLAGILGDQILNSILSELSHGFHSDLKPLLAGLNALSRGEAHPCEADIEKHCQSDHDHGHHHESELHCLGLHANDLSEACSKEVRQSLPFMCTREISHYCPPSKTIETSVLQCLEDKLDAGSAMGDDCKDSLAATRAIVAKMKTQILAIVDKRTGALIKSPTSALAAPLFFGAYAIVIAVLGLLLYAFWVRDDETSFFKSITRTFRELRVKMKGGPKQQREPMKTVELKSNYL